MKILHTRRPIDISLSCAIQNHSADRLIVYKSVDGSPLHLGVYFPKAFDPTKRHSAFFMIHGGGWSSHHVFEFWQGDYLGL